MPGGLLVASVQIAVVILCLRCCDWHYISEYVRVVEHLTLHTCDTLCYTPAWPNGLAEEVEMSIGARERRADNCDGMETYMEGMVR